jgi:uncharacterized protein
MRYRMKSFTGNRTAAILIATALIGLAWLNEAGAKSHAPFPSPDSGYVTDLAGVLSSEQEQRIEEQLNATEERSGGEIIVVIVNSIADYPGTPNRTIEEFARGLFDAYKIGNMPRNDGVLLLVAVRDRKARIELGAGYGRVRDADASRIMDRTIVPFFRKGRYADGVAAGVTALTREFGGAPSRWSRVTLFRWASPAIIVALALAAVSLFRHGKRGWGWVCLGLIVVVVLALVWLSRRAMGVLTDPDTPGGHRGFGDIGGFGGGFSGGGGATGSW